MKPIKPILTTTEWTQLRDAVEARIGPDNLDRIVSNVLGVEALTALRAENRPPADIEERHVVSMVAMLRELVPGTETEQMEWAMTLAFDAWGQTDRARAIVAYAVDRVNAYRIRVGDVLPASASAQTISAQSRKHLAVCTVHSLAYGQLLLGTYDNDTRSNCWLDEVRPDGSLRNIMTSESETFGYGEAFGDLLYIPMETRSEPAIAVNRRAELVRLPFAPPAEYCARIVKGEGCFIRRGNGHHNIMFSYVLGQPTGVAFPALNGMVSGLVKRDATGEWIAASIDKGIQSSLGWHIDAGCPEVIERNGEVLAFLRNGDVHTLDGANLGRKIVSTGMKPMRAVLAGGLVYWVTYRKTQLWVTDGRTANMLIDFGDDYVDPMASGTLFGASITPYQDGLAIAMSVNDKNGYEIHHVIPRA